MLCLLSEYYLHEAPPERLRNLVRKITLRTAIGCIPPTRAYSLCLGPAPTSYFVTKVKLTTVVQKKKVTAYLEEPRATNQLLTHGVDGLNDRYLVLISAITACIAPDTYLKEYIRLKVQV